MKRYPSIIATFALSFTFSLASAAPTLPGLDPDLSFDADNPGSNPGVWDNEQGQPFAFDLDPGAERIAVSDASAPAISNAYRAPAAEENNGNSLSQNTGLSDSQDVTFEFMIRTAVDGQNQLLFETGGGTGAGLTIWPRGGDFSGGEPDADDDDRFKVRWTVSESGTRREVDSLFISDSQLGEWTHIVAVADLDEGLTLFLNGVERASMTFDASNELSSWTGGNPAGLGTISGGNPTLNFADFKGDIAFARFYQQALTGDDAEALFQQTLVPEPSALGMSLLGLGFLLMNRHPRK